MCNITSGNDEVPWRKVKQAEGTDGNGVGGGHFRWLQKIFLMTKKQSSWMRWACHRGWDPAHKWRPWLQLRVWTILSSNRGEGRTQRCEAGKWAERGSPPHHWWKVMGDTDHTYSLLLVSNRCSLKTINSALWVDKKSTEGNWVAFLKEARDAIGEEKGLVDGVTAQGYCATWTQGQNHCWPRARGLMGCDGYCIRKVGSNQKNLENVIKSLNFI